MRRSSAAKWFPPYDFQFSVAESYVEWKLFFWSIIRDYRSQFFLLLLIQGKFYWYCKSNKNFLISSNLCCMCTLTFWLLQARRYMFFIIVVFFLFQRHRATTVSFHHQMNTVWSSKHFVVQKIFNMMLYSLLIITKRKSSKIPTWVYNIYYY